MSLGEQIAAEVAAGIREAAIATGDGELVVTFIRAGEATGPSYAPTFGPPTRHDATAILSNFTVRERESSLVALNDLKLLVANDGLTINPTTQDKIEVQGVEYQIKNIDPVKPGGVILMWSIHIGK